MVEHSGLHAGAAGAAVTTANPSFEPVVVVVVVVVVVAVAVVVGQWGSGSNVVVGGFLYTPEVLLTIIYVIYDNLPKYRMIYHNILYKYKIA